MASDVRVSGGAKIAAVAAALRHLGTDRTIVNEMAKEIRRVSPDMRQAIKDSAIEHLPKRGGLNRWVAAAKVRTSIRRSPRSAGITFVVSRNSIHGKTDMDAINRGRLRHPVFGNRRKWVVQAVEPGFGDKALQGPIADDFRDAAHKAIDKAIEAVLHHV